MIGTANEEEIPESMMFEMLSHILYVMPNQGTDGTVHIVWSSRDLRALLSKEALASEMKRRHHDQRGVTE
jgi:hypothetical protein